MFLDNLPKKRKIGKSTSDGNYIHPADEKRHRFQCAISACMWNTEVWCNVKISLRLRFNFIRYSHHMWPISGLKLYYFNYSSRQWRNRRESLHCFTFRLWVYGVQQGPIRDEAPHRLHFHTTPPVFTIRDMSIIMILNSHVNPFHVSCPALMLRREKNWVTHCYATVRAER